MKSLKRARGRIVARGGVTSESSADQLTVELLSAHDTATRRARQLATEDASAQRQAHRRLVGELEADYIKREAVSITYPLHLVYVTHPLHCDVIVMSL